ncbi:MAG: hypothetical protein M3093_03085 [Thermoproteota archaeon]|nr:hypothetical protein [Thermoproteota archaeon]
MLNTLQTTLFEMTITKMRFMATITTVLTIAMATTLTGFASLTSVFATSMTLGTTDQVGNDTSTDATTVTSSITGQEQQQTIHITKDGTNSYVLSGGSSSVGSFDTTYRIVGERSAIRASEDLIISTITSDYSSSPTIGYVSAGNTTTAGATADAATLPNPFVSPEQITERITSEVRTAISEAENNTPQGQLAEINCDFGMTLDDMHCLNTPLVGAEDGGDSATATTANATVTTSP